MSNITLKKSLESSIFSPVGDFITLFITENGILATKDSNGIVTHINGNILESLRYKCLLSTTLQYTDSGFLEIGKEYVITQLSTSPADDFTNVGYISDGIPFVATGTTPTIWANATKVHDIALNQPTEIIELVNTCGTMLIAWYYDDNIYGDFALKITQTGLFLEDKFFAPFLLSNNQKIERLDDDNAIIRIGATHLSKFPIEFEIYQ